MYILAQAVQLLKDRKCCDSLSPTWLFYPFRHSMNKKSAEKSYLRSLPPFPFFLSIVNSAVDCRFLLFFYFFSFRILRSLQFFCLSISSVLCTVSFAAVPCILIIFQMFICSSYALNAIWFLILLLLLYWWL